MKWTRTVVVAVGYLAMLVGCGKSGGTGSEKAVELKGSATVAYGSFSSLRNVTVEDIEGSKPCTGGQLGKGFDDFHAGTEVVVKDQANVTIATGQLGTGFWGDHGCRFEFTVRVPVAEFYRVEVGHRGGATLSRADLLAGKSLDLSLG